MVNTNVMTKPEENTQYLLVSDSNERSGQFDSKKLSHAELSDLAQDELFKTYLNDMSKYLKKTKFQDLCQNLNVQLDNLKNQYADVAHKSPSNKFRVVDGQVIFIHKDTLDNYNKTSSKNYSPIEYLRENWDITSEYQVNEILNCMLCGVTVPSEDGRTELCDQVYNPHGDKVKLDEHTFPNHMHHNGITNGAKVSCLEEEHTQNLGYDSSAIRYDLFHNDSNSSGLDNNNKMDGVVDKFQVNDCGDENLFHNNLPSYGNFYAFEIRKIQ